MNRIRIPLLAVMVLGISSLVFAQEPDKEPKAEPQKEAPREAAPPRAEEQPKAEEPKASKPDKQEKMDKQDKMERQDAQKPGKEDAKPGHDEKGEQTQMAHAHPAGKSAHIPDQKFKASFGSQHRFTASTVITQRTVVAGQTQFVYSGYTFVLVDAWPAEWAYTDDCYIDYMNDEYVLVDVVHPGIYITLFVVS